MRDLIRGLARPMLTLTRPMLTLMGQDDRGVAGLLVAILIGGGVLLGVGALAIDVGQIYAERAQLQSGADAGALAVARDCANGVCTPSSAQSYANSNSGHGSAAVSVCGSGGLGACPTTTGALTDCPPDPPAGTNFVDVRTSTLMPSGSTLLPPVFASTLVSGYNGTTVRACAQADWGPPSAAFGVGVTFSACSWDLATNSGAVFAAQPPAVPAASYDQVMKLHTTTSSTSCPTEPAGADAPGNFGWTLDPKNDCTTPIISGSYGGQTGNGVTAACMAALSADQANKTVIYIPIYVSVSGTGGNATFTLKGFAAFVITGYSLPGFFASDWLNPANDCKGSDKCINGYFTQGLIPNPVPIGGQDLGANVIWLTG
jgi:Flp pilus assembly protein TadG